MSVIFRDASVEDTAAIVDLVNRAYEVERFFVLGDRASLEVVARAVDRREFIVAMSDDAIVGAVHVVVDGDAATFGMLAVAPAFQGRGIGHQLIEQAEQRARDAGRETMEIQVVNLRVDLFGLYERLGYRVAGRAPYVDRTITQPCDFVIMRKELC